MKARMNKKDQLAEWFVSLNVRWDPIPDHSLKIFGFMIGFYGVIIGNEEEDRFVSFVSSKDRKQKLSDLKTNMIFDINSENHMNKILAGIILKERAIEERKKMLTEVKEKPKFIFDKYKFGDFSRYN